MGLDFFKKIFKKEEEKKETVVKTGLREEQRPAPEERRPEPATPRPAASPEASKPAQKPAPEKPLSEKTDDDLAGEINQISPEILAQAKTPEQRKMVINIYRRMLEDKVDINNEKEVKKWLKKHPEAAQGGEPAPRVETYKREEPKVGRNEPCPCGSGKKYKKCCGKEK